MIFLLEREITLDCKKKMNVEVLVYDSMMRQYSFAKLSSGAQLLSSFEVVFVRDSPDYRTNQLIKIKKSS